MLKNQEKFSLLKSYNLPLQHYVITGSGPLGIRGLREMGDLDILVSDKLWDRLSKSYGIVHEKGQIKILFPEGVISAFREGSFTMDMFDEARPSLQERLAQAEIFDGLPFENLEHVLFFKRKGAREKDLRDIALIESWQKEHAMSSSLATSPL